MEGRDTETRQGLPPDVRDENPAVAQFNFGESAAHVVAGFVAVFRERQANDFQAGAAIELNEKIRQKREFGARSSGRLQNVSSARVDFRRERD